MNTQSFSAPTFWLPVGADASSAIEAIASCAGLMKNAYFPVMPRLLKPLSCGSLDGSGLISFQDESSVRLNRSEIFFSSPNPTLNALPSRE